ncbi:MAG: hypothetical protein ABSH03_21330 [Candidatus Lustribacter sp.]
MTDAMVNGTFLRRDGKFTQLDEREIVSRAHSWCEKFVADYRQMLAGEPWHRRVHAMFERA